MGMRDTRLRIVEAIVALHEEVGPAATTVTAIAEKAGVQRLTVYRHFPDDQALLDACSAHWLAGHPLPDPVGWAGIPDPRTRLEAALTDVYGFFRDGAPMLESIISDEAKVPELAVVMKPLWAYMQEVAGGLSAGWGANGDAQRLVRAAVVHALDFHTWRSLTDQGLSNAEAAELMVGLVADVAAAPRAVAGPELRAP